MVQIYTESNPAARDHFEKATNIDPSYADAYSGLAWTYSSDYDFDWTDDHDKTLRLTLEMAEKAVSLDRNDYQANGHWDGHSFQPRARKGASHL